MRAHSKMTTLTSIGLLVLASGLSACGGDDDSPSADSTGGTTTSATASVLGPVNEAKGEPITIGFVGTGKSATVDNTDETKAAQAAADYANKYLGGLNGRPIKLKVCEDKNIPASGEDCARQFVAANTPAVVSGSSGVIGQITKVLDQSAVANFSNLTSDPGVLASPNAFVFANPLAAFGSSVAYAKSKGYKKLSLIVIDVPGASGPAKQLWPLLASNIGATGNVVPIAPGTPDMSAAIQAEAAKNPELFHLIGDPTFCATALKAIKGLGLKQEVTGLDRCTNPVTAKSIPGGYKGLIVTSQANFDPTTDEYKLFADALKEFGSGAVPSPTGSSGWGGMLGYIRLMNGAKVTDYTSAGMIAAAKASPAVNLPLGAGAKMQCTGKVSPFSPAICSDFSVVADAAEDGSLSNFRNLDSTGIYVLPTN